MSAHATDTIPLPAGRQEPVAQLQKPQPMRLLKTETLRGCNIYHRTNVIRQCVDLAELKGLRAIMAGREFVLRFAERFGRLDGTPRRSNGSGAFATLSPSIERCRFEDLLLEAVMALERTIAFTMRRLEPVAYAAVFDAGGQRVDLVWESDSPRLSRDIARAAAAGIRDLLPDALSGRRVAADAAFDVLLAALRRRALRRRRSMTAAVLASAARKRGVPCVVLADSYLLLGQGVAQRVVSSWAHQAPGIASRLQNRRVTQLALAARSLPVPAQVEAESRDEVLAAVRGLGYPVVIKPLSGRRGAGIGVDLRTPADVLSAFNRARRQSPVVLVEPYVNGQAYRLLVVGGHVVAAARLNPPRVVGDGLRTVAELIEAFNTRPERDELSLRRIRVDHEIEAYLHRRGHRLREIPRCGEEVVLYPMASAALGAVASDVSDAVHPTYKALAVSAAAALELDVAGIDLVTMDITRPYPEAGGTIVGVTDQPDLALHAVLGFGQARDVGGAVLELSFPVASAARIPTAVIAGRRGTFRTARELEALLRASGLVVALATRKRTRIRGERVSATLVRRSDAARFLLRDSRVEALVAAASPLRIARRGLQIDGCTAAAILDSGDDRADAEATRPGFEVVAKSAARCVLVDAAGPFAAEALQSVPPGRLVLLARERTTTLVGRHMKADGAVLRWLPAERRIVLERAGGRIAAVSLPSPGKDREEGDETRLRARIVAVGLALGLGLADREIEAVIRNRAKLRN